MSDSPEVEEKNPSMRYFKLYDVRPDGNSPEIYGETLKNLRDGEYTGRFFLHATKKIFWQICRVTDCECKYIFSIQEVTKNSGYKVNEYRGERIKLAKPEKIKKGVVEYVVCYKCTLTGMGPVDISCTKSATR